MNRLFHWLDLGLGLALASALTMLMLTAWPRAAWAAERVAGSGRPASEARAVGAFDAVVVDGDIGVHIVQTAQESVQLRADDNLLPLLETVVETRDATRTLRIRWRKDVQVRSQVPAAVDLGVVRLQSLALNGSRRVVVEALATPRLQLSLSGSGDVRLEALNSDELSVAIAGSGDVKAAGRAARVHVKVSGSGDVDALALKADEVDVRIAGSGDVAVHADKALAVAISGSGDVRYSGDAVVQSKVAGSGSVRKR